MREKILCVEDDPTIQELVRGSLQDYQVVVAENLAQAEQELEREHFQAIVLDIQLPDGDGLRFYTRLAKDPKFRKLPALFLSGHSEISNKLMAFSVGADDFIAKPFDPMELSARVSLRIKKRNEEAEGRRTQSVGDIEIDLDRQKAFQMNNGHGQDLGLTSIELKILTLLSRRLEQVFSRDQILSGVWGETHITDRTVDSHIAHLRSKIGNSKVKVETVKNSGYRTVVLA